jgi:hypothetical protein
MPLTRGMHVEQDVLWGGVCGIYSLILSILLGQKSGRSETVSQGVYLNGYV